MPVLKVLEIGQRQSKASSGGSNVRDLASVAERAACLAVFRLLHHQPAITTSLFFKKLLHPLHLYTSSCPSSPTNGDVVGAADEVAWAVRMLHRVLVVHGQSTQALDLLVDQLPALASLAFAASRTRSHLSQFLGELLHTCMRAGTRSMCASQLAACFLHSPSAHPRCFAPGGDGGLEIRRRLRQRHDASSCEPPFPQASEQPTPAEQLRFEMAVPAGMSETDLLDEGYLTFLADEMVAARAPLFLDTLASVLVAMVPGQASGLGRDDSTADQNRDGNSNSGAAALTLEQLVRLNAILSLFVERMGSDILADTAKVCGVRYCTEQVPDWRVAASLFSFSLIDRTCLPLLSLSLRLCLCLCLCLCLRVCRVCLLHLCLPLCPCFFSPTMLPSLHHAGHRPRPPAPGLSAPRNTRGRAWCAGFAAQRCANDDDDDDDDDDPTDTLFWEGEWDAGQGVC